MMTGRRTHEFTIGDRLRKAREVAGYDQREFEAASGISRATIGAYELGKSTPKRAYLSIWANVTDTDIDWLMYGDAGTGESYEPDTNDPRVGDDTSANVHPSADGEPQTQPPPKRKSARGWGAPPAH